MSTTAANPDPVDALIPVLQPAGWFGAGLELLERPLVRRAGRGAGRDRDPPVVALAWSDDGMLLFPQASQLRPHRWEELLEASVENLRRRHPPRWRYRSDAQGQLCLGLVEGRFAASYAVDARLLRRAHARFGSGRLLLAVPCSDRLVVTTGRAFAAAPFAALVEGLYDLAAAPVSRAIFVSVGGRLGGPLDLTGGP